MADLGYATKLDRTPEHWNTLQLALELLGLERLIHQWSMTPRLSSDAEQLLQELKSVFPKTFRTASENELRAKVFWNSEGWELCRDAFADMLEDGLNERKDWTTCLEEFRRDLEDRFELSADDQSTTLEQPIDVDHVVSRFHRSETKRDHEPLTVVNLQETIADLTAHGDRDALADRQHLQFKMGLRDARMRVARARSIAQSRHDSKPCGLSMRDYCEHAGPTQRAYRLATLFLPERLFRTVGR